MENNIKQEGIHQFKLRCPEDLFTEIEALARGDKRSVNKFIIMALDEIVSKRKKNKKR